MHSNPHRVQLTDSRHSPEQHTPATANSHHEYPAPDYRKPIHRSAKVGSISLLLALPSESLAHITSYLDPESLFELSRTCKLLYEHVNDDVTWHQAFSWHFFGDEETARSHLLWRTEDTWKREFVSRSNISRLWWRSRSGTISHIPHHSTVNGMYLFADRSYGPSLLSTSLQYGVVARSQPLSGKVFRGFLSAVSDRIGIGNPNAEFSPNVSVCSIFVEDWMIKILWGHSTGKVSVTSSSRVIDPSRTSAARIMYCSVADEHMGRVIDASWDLDGAAFVTVGADSIVKVWESTCMKCFWILRNPDTRALDACIQLVSDLRRGLILMTTTNNAVVVWKLNEVFASLTMHQPNLAFPVLVISPPCSSCKAPVRLFLDPEGTDNVVSYGICFSEDKSFYRVNLDISLKKWEYVHFTNGPLGPLRVTYPCFKEAGNGTSVVIAGDELGRISFFNWSETPLSAADDTNIPEVSSFAQLSAFDDGAVTAITCNPYILAAGSSHGSTKVWELLSLRLLRSFPSPSPRRNSDIAVSQIVLDRDMIVCSVGSIIMGWETGHIKAHRNHRKIKITPKLRNEKWYGRLEMSQDIAESHHTVKMIHDREQCEHERHRAQLKLLDKLGLDETEAVDYAIMLSREEEEERQRNFDLQHGLITTSSSSSSASSTTKQSESDAGELATSSGVPSYPLTCLISPLMSSSMDVKRTSSSSQAIDDIGTYPNYAALDDSMDETGSFPALPAVRDSIQFPAMPSAPESSARSYKSMSMSMLNSSPSSKMGSSASGPTIFSKEARADGDKAQSISRIETRSVPRLHRYAEIVQTRVSSSSAVTGRSLSRREAGQVGSVPATVAHPRQVRPMNDNADEDADLQFAIELSLAEALSRQQI